MRPAFGWLWRARSVFAAKPWLAPWLTGWLLVLATTGMATLLFSAHSPTSVGPEHWDATHYVWIAQHGYSAAAHPHYAYGSLAFFPALPALMWLLHPLFGGSFLAAGMVLTGLATGSASRSLFRYVQPTHGPRVALLAVWLMCCNPYSFVLYAPFTEALLLALAIPALAAARSGRWRTAGLLAGVAASVRITGVFVAAAVTVALVLDLATRRREAGRARWRDGAWLVAAPVVYGCWVAYQHHLSGRWNTTGYLERTVWYRWTVWPWDGLAQTLSFITRTDRAATAAEFSVEIVAMVGLVAVSACLARRRRWLELLYVGGPTLLLATSSYYSSNQRGLLVAFPAFILAASWLSRRPRTVGPVLACCAALAVFMTVAYDSGMYFTG